jgi:hypothetical protein
MQNSTDDAETKMCKSEYDYATFSLSEQLSGAQAYKILIQLTYTAKKMYHLHSYAKTNIQSAYLHLPCTIPCPPSCRCLYSTG